MGGLACALYLRSTGREVTVLERDSAPGGRLDAVLEIDGYRFDTGPAYTMTPECLAMPLEAVGEQLSDWIEMLPVDPICRAHYPDGTTIDVHSDAGRTTASIAAVCGRGEAAAYLRYLKLARYRVPARAVLRDERTRRLFGAAVLFGFSITENAWYPSGGANAVPRMLAGVAEKHGIFIRYESEVMDGKGRWPGDSARTLMGTDSGDAGESRPGPGVARCIGLIWDQAQTRDA